MSRRLTARDLDGRTRPERLRMLWAAMSPASRKAAWARLDGGQRADVIAACFRVSEEPAPAAPPTVTYSAAIERWQRENDR